MARAPHDESEASEDFLAWARLSARMFRRPVAERARMVHDAGLEDRWRDLDARWFEVIAADVAAGRLERLDRYLFLCEAARREREAAGERVPSLVGERLHAAASSRPPPPDGRHRASSRPPPPRRGASRATDSVTPPFARPLAPAGARPAPPRPGQSTTAILKSDLREAVATGDRAARWSVEEHAWLSAELAVAPERAAAIWAAHDVAGEAAVEAVQAVWEAKLTEDASLGVRHRALVARFTAAIRRGDRSGAPPRREAASAEGDGPRDGRPAERQTPVEP